MSSAATPKHAPSSQTSVETSQEESMASAGTMVTPNASYTNLEDAVLSQTIRSIYDSQPTSSSMTTQITPPKDSVKSLHAEEQDDHIEGMQFDYSRYSRRASRYSQFSPDLVEALGYPVSAPVTASTRSRQSVFWDQNASFIAEEPDTFRSANTQSRRRGSGTAERDQVSTSSEQRRISRPSLPNSSPSKPTCGHSQVPQPAIKNTEKMVEPRHFLEQSRSRTDIASAPPLFNLGGDSAMRSFRQSGQPESSTIVREEGFQVERHTLKPTSNNGAVFSSRQTTSLIKAGHKRRCTEETFTPVRRYSVHERRLAGSSSQSIDNPIDSTVLQRKLSAHRRGGTRMRSIREHTESLEHTTVTFTIDENGRAKAQRIPIVNQSSSNRQAYTSYIIEDGEATDSEGSTDSDFAMATSRIPSFTVMDENRHLKHSRGDVESCAQQQPSFGTLLKCLDSHSRHLRLGSSAHLTSCRKAIERARDDRVQARVRASLLSTDHISGLTDDVESEAETILDGDDGSSDSDPDAKQTFETGPRRTGMTYRKRPLDATHPVSVC